MSDEELKHNHEEREEKECRYNHGEHEGHEEHEHDAHEHHHEHAHHHEHERHELANEHGHGEHEHEHTHHHHGGHGHHHHHCACHDDDCCEEDDDEEEEGFPWKLVWATVCFALALLVQKLPVFSLNGKIANGNQTIFLIIKGVYLALYLAAYLISGMDVLREAVENLVHGKFFGEEFLMSVATIGAVVLGEYSEAVAVMILFGFGEFLEEKAVGKSRASIKALVAIRPDQAWLKKDGTLVQVKAETVMPGDTIVVKPGERVPLDGEVTDGASELDTSALTGESVPRSICAGGMVLSGFVNISGVLEVLVKKPFAESSASRVLELVEKSQAKKASTEKFITRFAKVYTPIVCILAVALAVIPSVILGGTGEVWRTWIYRALELLVVSCPCALVISVPLSFFAGIGMASKKGILVKGASYIEALEKTKTVVFDKTGTLTQGVFEVTEVCPRDESAISKEELLALATHAEYFSNHPISRSLKLSHSCPLCERLSSQSVEEISGNGVRAFIEGKKVLVGNLRFLQNEGIENLPQNEEIPASAVVHVAKDGVYQGYVLISDMTKADSLNAISGLRKNKITRTVMLTGDNKKVAEAVAKELGIDEVYAELLPDGKVQRLEAEIEKLKGTKGCVAFVGDGINDAPVLTRSDVGIAMGAMGSDSAIEAADVVIMDDNVGKVSLAITLAKKTMRNVWQNVGFALGVKTLIMVLCACGIANMWIAVFGDVGVTMLAVLNSMRLLLSGKKR